MFFYSLFLIEDVFDTQYRKYALPSSEKLKYSKLGDYNASDFRASQGLSFEGFGFTSHCPFFDPTDSDVNSEFGGRRIKLYSLFNKTCEEISTALLGETPHTIAAKLSRTIVVVYNDLSKVAETSTSIKSSRLGRNMNIQNHHLDIIMTFVPQLKTTTISNSRGRLSDNNCSLGIANESSVPDGYFKDSEMNARRGIFEVRHGTDAPAEGIRQGAASASNVALCQFQHGVNVEDIVVPIIGSNGYLMQFAAVIMLKPSFPILVMLSSVLDLTDNKMLLEAARLLCCVRILTSHPLNLRRNQVPISRLKIAYSTRECDFVLKIT